MEVDAPSFVVLPGQSLPLSAVEGKARIGACVWRRGCGIAAPPREHLLSVARFHDAGACSVGLASWHRAVCVAPVYMCTCVLECRVTVSLGGRRHSVQPCVMGVMLLRCVDLTRQALVSRVAARASSSRLSLEGYAHDHLASFGWNAP